MGRKQKYDKSRRMLDRERFGLTDPEPSYPEPDLSLRAAVFQLFKKLDCQTDSIVRQIQRKWSLIAGENVAAHSCPGRLVGDILYVYVDSSAWLAEIKRFHSDDILRRIQAETGPGAVKGMRFQVDPKQSHPPFA